MKKWFDSQISKLKRFVVNRLHSPLGSLIGHRALILFDSTGVVFFAIEVNLRALKMRAAGGLPNHC